MKKINILFLAPLLFMSLFINAYASSILTVEIDDRVQAATPLTVDVKNNKGKLLCSAKAEINRVSSPCHISLGDKDYSLGVTAPNLYKGTITLKNSQNNILSTADYELTAHRSAVIFEGWTWSPIRKTDPNPAYSSFIDQDVAGECRDIDHGECSKIVRIRIVKTDNSKG